MEIQTIAQPHNLITRHQPRIKVMVTDIKNIIIDLESIMIKLFTLAAPIDMVVRKTTNGINACEEIALTHGKMAVLKSTAIKPTGAELVNLKDKLRIS